MNAWLVMNMLLEFPGLSYFSFVYTQPSSFGSTALHTPLHSFDVVIKFSEHIHASGSALLSASNSSLFTSIYEKLRDDLEGVAAVMAGGSTIAVALKPDRKEDFALQRCDFRRFIGVESSSQKKKKAISNEDEGKTELSKKAVVAYIKEVCGSAADEIELPKGM